MPNMIKVIIADDHKIFAEGLTLLLEQEEGISIVGSVSHGKSLLGVLANQEADVVLLDINMPEMNGIEAAKEIVHRFPSIKLLILTMYDSVEMITQILKSGASGYLVKNSSRDEIIAAIRDVASGKPYFSEEVSRA